MCIILCARSSGQFNVLHCWVLNATLRKHRKYRYYYTAWCRRKKKRKKPQRIKVVIKITLLGLHTRKWTSNHPANPDNLVRSMLMLNTTFDLTLRISSTVAVIQSISLMTAEVPITWLGWRLFHNEVWKFKATTDKKLYPKKRLTSSYNMSLKEEKTKDVRV